MKARHRSTLYHLNLAFTLICNGCTPTGTVPIEEALTPLPDGFFELSGDPANWSDKDLVPFGNVSQRYDNVALGEAHHTSDGFYRAKNSLIKYLIERHGFRAIAFEDNWNRAQEVNKYIAGGSHDPIAALMSLSHQVWWAESIRELIVWLREYNDKHPTDKVVFFGFDMQDPSYAKEYLLTHTHDNELFRKTASLTLNSFDARKACRDKGPWEACEYIRDQAMADIFIEMKDRVASAKKTVLWAANGHIIKYNLGSARQSSMGYFLSQRIKDNYASFILVAAKYETHHAWHDAIPSQETAPSGSLEEGCASYGRGGLFIDFKKLTAELFSASEEEFENFSPAKAADGAIYLKHSKPMVLLKEGEAKPTRP